MSLPDQIKVAPFTYKIKYQDDVASGADVCLGIFSYPKREIRVATSDVHENVQAAIILHESIHAMLEHAGVREHCEHHIDAFVHGIIPFIHDNPEFIRTLLEGVK